MRNGRSPNNNFRAYHRVYFRIEQEDLIGTRVNPNRLTVFDMSVNWSKYSRAMDVIIGYPKWGIVRLLAAYLPVILPVELQQRGQKKNKFCLEHDPEDDNYSHSQIACYKDDGVRVTSNNKVSPAAKKELKALLSDRCIVILNPEA